MLIESVDCQKIVNKLMDLLGNNINIMNEKGVIIASGDKSRIQSFHEAAKIAISHKKMIIVDNNNIEKEAYKGAQKGINIPIYFNNNVVGVVGITGEPSKVKDLGVIVKELVELMIQEEERKKIELYHTRTIKNFAKELIKEHDEKDKDVFSYRSQLVDFKLDIPRVVIVLDVNFFSSYIQNYGEDSEVTKEMVKQNIVDIINSISTPNVDLAINLYMERFVIFKNCNDDLESYCKRVQEELCNKYIIKLAMGIGSVCTKFEDYSKSYVLASKVVNIGKRIHPERNIYFVKDYKLQMILNYLSNEQKDEYLKSTGLQELKNKDIDVGTKEMLNTVKVYFETGMNIQKTANKLFVHRNTVNYRIAKFKETFNVDINDAYSCSMVYIGIILLEL